MSTNEKIAGQAEDMELTPEKFKIIGFTQEEANKNWSSYDFLLAGRMATVAEKSGGHGFHDGFGAADRYGYHWTSYAGVMTI